MKIIYYSIFALSALFIGCDVEKTEEGESPDLDVDVEADAGEAPEYDVDWANVNVGERTKTVKVPKVVVVMEEEEVEVPYLDVSMPDNGKNVAEQTIKVEVEVSEYMHEIDIEKVYALSNKLIVISELEREAEALEQNRVRISDQIIINAPDDLVIRHYIIGDQPQGDFNSSYSYIASENDISEKIADANVIYGD